MMSRYFFNRFTRLVMIVGLALGLFVSNFASSAAHAAPSLPPELIDTLLAQQAQTALANPRVAGFPIDSQLGMGVGETYTCSQILDVQVDPAQYANQVIPLLEQVHTGCRWVFNNDGTSTFILSSGEEWHGYVVQEGDFCYIVMQLDNVTIATGLWNYQGQTYGFGLYEWQQGVKAAVVQAVV